MINLELNTHVGGRPGIDCGGFCEFCFYKNVDLNKIESLALGCTYCPPNQIGCDHCQEPINRVKNKFKSINEVLIELGNKLMALELWGSLDYDDIKVTISGGADVFYYPHLKKLVTALKEPGMKTHIGYISGKGIKAESTARNLILQGVDEISFSVFSTSPHMRRRWMGDKNPEQALKALKLFCENIEVNASVVVVPGINEYEKIFQTCSDLEEWGVKSFVLRRFANFKIQGLILNDNKPVMEGVTPHTYEEFRELVKRVSDEFSFKVMSFPFYDPKKGFPFALLRKENKKYLEELPPVKSPATIITGKLAEPFLKKLLAVVDELGLVNVVGVDKEIADLITPEDLESIGLAEVKRNVIVPGGALVHHEQALEILGRDGTARKIKRGPFHLTHPYHENIDFNNEQLINFERKSFKELIDIINI